MDDLDSFDIVLVGTSLVQAVTAAALAKAGYKVLHLDVNEYYGSHSASLNLNELLEWAEIHKKQGYEDRFSSITYSFSSSSVMPPELASSSRHYSISLSPSLISSNGELIETLIRSGVSRYGGFRLLEGIALYTAHTNQGVTPSLSLVPSSKEDIFKNKSMSLVQKRKLMKFLQFATGSFEESAEIQSARNSSLRDFIQAKFSLPPTVSSAIAYAVAHASSDEESVEPALQRLRRYSRSTGRYGNSPFLVGHYGGIGELAQGFCRLCAVHGGTYILGRSIEFISLTNRTLSEGQKTEPSYSIKIRGIPQTLSARAIVRSREYILSDTSTTSPQVLARCIAVVDGPIAFPRPDAVQTEEDGAGPPTPTPMDTFYIVFPPGSLGDNGKASNAVNVLITGEGTRSCPAGEYILYFCTSLSEGADEDVEALLQPYLAALTALSDSASSFPRILFSLFYRESLSPSFPMNSETGKELPSNGTFLVEDAPPFIATFSEVGDAAVRESERAFWEIVGQLSSSGREVPASFWPPLEEDVEDEEEW